MLSEKGGILKSVCTCVCERYIYRYLSNSKSNVISLSLLEGNKIFSGKVKRGLWILKFLFRTNVKSISNLVPTEEWRERKRVRGEG